MSKSYPVESVVAANIKYVLLNADEYSVPVVVTGLQLVVGSGGLRLNLNEGDKLMMRFPVPTSEHSTHIASFTGEEIKVEKVEAPYPDGDLFDKILLQLKTYRTYDIYPGLKLGDWVLIEDAKLIFYDKDPELVYDKVTRDCLIRRLVPEEEEPEIEIG